LDNDALADLGDRLEQAFGARNVPLWEIFGRLREQLGLAIIWQACRRFDPDSTTSGLARHVGVSAGYPFAARLFPRALEAVAHLNALGRPVVLSDGDIVFQPRKIQRSEYGCGPRPRHDLPAQGTRARPYAAALSGQALCHGRRQAESAAHDTVVSLS